MPPRRYSCSRRTPPEEASWGPPSFVGALEERARSSSSQHTSSGDETNSEGRLTNRMPCAAHAKKRVSAAAEAGCAAPTDESGPRARSRGRAVASLHTTKEETVREKRSLCVLPLYNTTRGTSPHALEERKGGGRAKEVAYFAAKEVE